MYKLIVLSSITRAMLLDVLFFSFQDFFSSLSQTAFLASSILILICFSLFSLLSVSLYSHSYLFLSFLSIPASLFYILIFFPFFIFICFSLFSFYRLRVKILKRTIHSKICPIEYCTLGLLCNSSSFTLGDYILIFIMVNL